MALLSEIFDGEQSAAERAEQEAAADLEAEAASGSLADVADVQDPPPGKWDDPAEDSGEPAPRAAPDRAQVTRVSRDPDPENDPYVSREDTERLDRQLEEAEARQEADKAWEALTPPERARLEYLSAAKSLEGTERPGADYDPEGARRHDLALSAVQDRLMAAYRASAEAAGADFQDAYSHAVGGYLERLRAANPNANDDQLQGALLGDELRMVAQTMRSGGDPAAAVLRVARAYGWESPAERTSRDKSLKDMTDAEQEAHDVRLRRQFGARDVDSLTDAEFDDYIAAQRAQNNPMRP